MDRNPEDIDARYYRGVVYETMGNLEGAIADFTTVLRLDPNHVKASYARGACQNVKGDFAEAISTIHIRRLLAHLSMHALRCKGVAARGGKLGRGGTLPPAQSNAWLPVCCVCSCTCGHLQGGRVNTPAHT